MSDRFRNVMTVAEPSIYAVACDLLGEDPNAPEAPRRPPVAQALARCPRGSVAAARGAGGEDVAVVVVEDGTAYVVPDACPHDGGPLSDGFVDAGRLVCARHGLEFEPDTGRCVSRSRLCLRAAPRRIVDRDP